jgi:hypothetical protein
MEIGRDWRFERILIEFIGLRGQEPSEANRSSRRALVGAEARQDRPVDIPPEPPGRRIDTASVSR